MWVALERTGVVVERGAQRRASGASVMLAPLLSVTGRFSTISGWVLVFW
jgi:hypothetical protein